MARLTSLSRSIDGRVAVVTGAASGMGRACARLFADEGARLVLVDRDPLDSVVEVIAAAYGPEHFVAVQGSVTDPGVLDRAVAAAIERFGQLDIVVNNAGVMIPTSVTDADDQDFEANWALTLDINLTAYVRLVRRALPHLQASDSARIVNIASTEALVTTPGSAAYAATKAGVAGLTRQLAVELGKAGITVNAICPGPINTAMTASIDAAAKAEYARRRVPLRRYGDPEEVAQMILNLCLPASSYVTGTTIPVDGGMTIRHT